MFTDNKYTRWYYRIIDRAIARQSVGYSERHHIIPKSLGGSDKKDNLIRLTAREHFVCHMLLVKMTTGEAKKKMSRAFWLMAKGTGKRYRPCSKLYEVARKLFVAAQTGHPNYLINHTEYAKKLISIAQKEIISTLTLDEITQRMKNSCCHPDSYTEERSNNISRSLIGRTIGENQKKNIAIGSSRHRKSLGQEQRNVKYGKQNSGKTWKLVDGKRVWFDREN